MKKIHTMTHYATTFLVTLLLLTTFTNQAIAQDKAAEKHVQIRLVPERTVIAPNDTIWIGIEETIDDGWHTYWVNAGDSGTPTKADWDLPTGFETSEISWPVPHKISTPPLTNYGYEKKVTLLQTLTAPSKLPEGPITFNVDIELLVCKEICIPEYSTHTLTFNNGTEEDNTAYINTASNALSYSVPWYATFGEADGKLVFAMSRPEATFLFKSIDQNRPMEFIPYDWGVVDNSAPSNVTIEDDTITVRQKRGDRPLRALQSMRGLIAYYDEHGKYSAFEITANPDSNATSATAQASTKISANSIETMNDNGYDAPETKNTAQTNAQDMSVLLALLFAFLGGIILNLMPCVFPILSMKALSLCKMHGKELKHARQHGIFYTAGILLTFGAIAGTLMVLKAGGAQIGWGFQLQNPSVILFLAWLLFVIGLNLAGFFNLSVVLSDSKAAQKDTAMGSFFTGILATLVATPCTAPFMGVALGFAIIQPPVIGMMVFLMLGLGLALPYLALCFLPKLRAFLPKPGVWMERFKEFLAFPMFLSAIWLVWVYTGQAGDDIAMIKALGGMVLITFGLWLVKITPTAKGTKKTVCDLFAFLVLVLVLTIFMIDMKSRQAMEAIDQHIGQASLEEDFTTARYEELLASGEPVFVNMTADWCITCKVNEVVALNTPATKMLFAAQKVHYVKGDWTNQNAEITTYLDKYGRNGVPLYVYYAPIDDSTGQRPEPVVLPQILTPGILKDTLTNQNNP